MRSFSQQKESGCRRRDEYAMMMGAASSKHGRTRPTRRRTRRGRLSSRQRRRRQCSSLVVSRRRGSGGRRRRVVSHLGDDDDVLSLFYKSKTRLFPSSPPRRCVGQKSFFFRNEDEHKTRKTTVPKRRTRVVVERVCVVFRESVEEVDFAPGRETTFVGKNDGEEMYKCAGKMNTQKESFCYYYYEDCALLRLLCALYYLVYIHMAVFPLKVNSTFSNKFPFSNAAATRSLSLSCLFTCVSDACEPSETFICFARRVRMCRKTTVLLERESRLGQCCRRRESRPLARMGSPGRKLPVSRPIGSQEGSGGRRWY